MRVSPLIVCAALTLASACGSPEIVIVVDSDLEITAEVDHLHLESFDPDEPDIALVNIRDPLREEWSFPIEILLQPSDSTPQKRLLFRCAALRGNLVQARGENTAAWDPDGSSIIHLVLERL